MTEIKFKKLSKEDIKALSNDSLSTEVRLEEAVKKSMSPVSPNCSNNHAHTAGSELIQADNTFAS